MFNLLKYTIVLISIINGVNTYDVNTFEQLLFNRLGIRNHMRKRRDTLTYHNNITNQDMLNLYSNLETKKTTTTTTTTTNNSFNIIRNFQTQIIRCNQCRSTLQTFKPRTKRFKQHQLLTLRDAFKFKFNYYNDQQEHLIKSDLELKFNFKPILSSFKFISNPNNYNEFKVDLYLNGKQVELINFNSTLAGLNAKLNRIQIHKINLTNLISTNFNSKSEFKMNLVLKVKFKTTLRVGLNSKLNQISDLLIQLPNIVTYSSDSKIVKSINDDNKEKTFTFNHQKTAASQQCGKKSFTISFKELGWDNVILEPKYLNSYYCAGSCDTPLDDNVQPTNHAILISLASRLKRFNYLPNVCCKPAKLAPKMFMFVDDHDNVVIKKIDNLIVESCSCQ